MTQGPEAPARTRARISERTFRTDPWWKTPRIVAAGLTIWVAYATAHVFAGHWYYVANVPLPEHPVRYWLWTRGTFSSPGSRSAR